MLVRGYETVSMGLIPQMNSDEFMDDPSFLPNSVNFAENYEKLSKVKNKLQEVYHSEFLATLVNQAIDKRDRYKPVLHKVLKPGDIVLLVEKHTKRFYYPMARVHSVETNVLGEVTSAYVYKGSTKELVYRHATSLILLISAEGFSDDRTNSLPNSTEGVSDSVPSVQKKQPARAAGEACKLRMKQQSSDAYV